MRTFGSSAAVVSAIREDVAAELERLAQQTAREVDRLRHDDAARPLTLPERAARLATARRLMRERLSQEDWEDARAALEERERWLVQAVAEGERALGRPESAPARRQLVQRLALEGLSRLSGRSFEVVVSSADAAVVDPEWCRALAAEAAKGEVRLVVAAVGGGCLVRGIDGRARFDNTFPARARRFESIWRAALGHLYEPVDVAVGQP